MGDRSEIGVLRGGSWLVSVSVRKLKVNAYSGEGFDAAVERVWSTGIGSTRNLQYLIGHSIVVGPKPSRGCRSIR